MKKYKLGNIQKENNCKLEEIIAFLALNGFAYEKDPNIFITEEAKTLIDFNFKSKTKTENIVKKERANKNLPIEIRILEAVKKEKLLTERIIGFTNFEWKYLITKYLGECSQPIPFNTFDEVICEILLRGNELSLGEIGKIIGLDTTNDPAAHEVMRNAIRPLVEPNKFGEKMVDGDESIYWLTPLGKEYAENGYKISTFNREFEIYWDLIGEEHFNIKKSLFEAKSERQSVVYDSSPYLNIEQIRKISEHQAPEIHFPEKGFNLLNVSHLKTQGFQVNVWVCFLENFRDNSTRAVVYDETQNKLIPDLSSILNSKTEITETLIEKLILNDETVSETKEQKTNEQLELEKNLIIKQEQIDAAIENKNLSIIPKLKKSIELNKIHFNTLEFELELKELFESTNDDVWIISPWIRKNAFSKRKEFIEDYLQKGGRVFVAYSKQELSKFSQKPMVDEESMRDLKELEKKFNRFYYCELPQFHYKNVWLRVKGEGNIYYNGSFNILSFFVNKNEKYVRQEKMAKHKWDTEIENDYRNVFRIFGKKYIKFFTESLDDMIKTRPKKLNQEYIAKALVLGNEKLKPFESVDIFRKEVDRFKEDRNDKTLNFRKELFEQEINFYREKVKSIPNNKLQRIQKSVLLNKFSSIRKQYEDLLELQMIAFEVQEMIQNIVVLGKKNKINRKNR